MNEEISKTLGAGLADLLTKLLQSVDTATDFAIEQMPLVVQELLRWTIVHGIVSVVIFTLLIVTSTMVLRNIFLEIKKVPIDRKGLWVSDGYPQNEISMLGIYTSIVCTLVNIVSVLIIVANIFTVMKVVIAPRIFIIEYIRSAI